MIGLLNAAFLAGLAAVAIPVVIHLVHRRRTRVIDFPSLRFLREADRRIASRRRIEELLLLLMRCAVLALLALGLARPLFRPTPTAGTGAATTAAIVLDDSYSMRTAAGGATRFERAKAAARRVLSTLKAGDSAALFLPNAGTTGPTTDLAAIREALDGAQPSFGAAKLRFDEAAKALADATTPARELLVLTDVQRGSWAEPKVPGDFRTHVVPVADATPENVTLAALDLLSPTVRTGSAARVRATLVNRSEAPQFRTVTFEMDGRPVGSEHVTLAALGRGAASVDMDLDRAGWHEVRASLEPDALPADDEAFLVLDAREKTGVLAVGATGEGPTQDAAFYLTRALAAGGGAEVTACAASDVGRLRLSDFAWVVCFGAPPPEVLAHVARGGAALVVGDGQVLEHDPASPVALREIDERHPIFRSLAAGDPPIDLGTASFYRTCSLAPQPGDDVLARFSDGSAAFVERPLGDGRLLLLASGLTPDWTNLPLKVGFVPFVHGVAAHLASGTAAERCRVGAALSVTYAADAPTVVRIGKEEHRVEKGAATFAPFREPGFGRLEEVFPAGPRERRLAVCVDPEEGDLARGDAAALAALFDHGKVTAPDALGPELDGARHGIELSAGAILLALALLVVESWFSNRVTFGR